MFFFKKNNKYFTRIVLKSNFPTNTIFKYFIKAVIILFLIKTNLIIFNNNYSLNIYLDYKYSCKERN